jgi:hypothetical protein
VAGGLIKAKEHPGLGRWLLDLARRTSGDRTAIALVVGNLVAVAIAVLHPPITASLMFLYWAECVIVGIFNIFKLRYVPPLNLKASEMERMTPREVAAHQAFTMAVFVVHYGIFVFMCFGMIHMLAMREMGRDFAAGSYYLGFLLPIAVLAVTHGVSFRVNFLGKREYIGRTGEQQMFKPYGRVLLMALTVFIGIGLVMVTNLPAAAAVLFVPAKLLADLHAHFRDHKPSTP